MSFAIRKQTGIIINYQLIYQIFICNTGFFNEVMNMLRLFNARIGAGANAVYAVTVIGICFYPTSDVPMPGAVIG